MKIEELVKPCCYLGFCPYGRLVEYFPMEDYRGIEGGITKNQCTWNNTKLDWIKPKKGKFNKYFNYINIIKYLI